MVDGSFITIWKRFCKENMLPLHDYRYNSFNMSGVISISLFVWGQFSGLSLGHFRPNTGIRRKLPVKRESDRDLKSLRKIKAWFSPQWLHDLGQSFNFQKLYFYH